MGKQSDTDGGCLVATDSNANGNANPGLKRKKSKRKITTSSSKSSKTKPKADRNSKCFPLTIRKQPYGENFWIQVEPSTRISSCTKKIQKMRGIPLGNIRLAIVSTSPSSTSTFWVVDNDKSNYASEDFQERTLKSFGITADGLSKSRHSESFAPKVFLELAAISLYVRMPSGKIIFLEDAVDVECTVDHLESLVSSRLISDGVQEYNENIADSKKMLLCYDEAPLQRGNPIGKYRIGDRGVLQVTFVYCDYDDEDLIDIVPPTENKKTKKQKDGEVSSTVTKRKTKKEGKAKAGAEVEAKKIGDEESIFSKAKKKAKEKSKKKPEKEEKKRTKADSKKKTERDKKPKEEKMKIEDSKRTNDKKKRIEAETKEEEEDKQSKSDAGAEFEAKMKKAEEVRKQLGSMEDSNEACTAKKTKKAIEGEQSKTVEEAEFEVKIKKAKEVRNKLAAVDKTKPKEEKNGNSKERKSKGSKAEAKAKTKAAAAKKTKEEAFAKAKAAAEAKTKAVAEAKKKENEKKIEEAEAKATVEIAAAKKALEAEAAQAKAAVKAEKEVEGEQKSKENEGEIKEEIKIEAASATTTEEEATVEAEAKKKTEEERKKAACEAKTNADIVTVKEAEEEAAAATKVAVEVEKEAEDEQRRIEVEVKAEAATTKKAKAEDATVKGAEKGAAKAEAETEKEVEEEQRRVEAEEEPKAETASAKKAEVEAETDKEAEEEQRRVEAEEKSEAEPASTKKAEVEAEREKEAEEEQRKAEAEEKSKAEAATAKKAKEEAIAKAKAAAKAKAKIAATMKAEEEEAAKAAAEAKKKAERVWERVEAKAKAKAEAAAAKKAEIKAAAKAKAKAGADAKRNAEAKIVIAPAGKLGLMLADKIDSTGCVVLGVQASSAMKDRLSLGDWIVAIDGEDVTRMTYNDIISIICRKAEYDREFTVVANNSASGSLYNDEIDGSETSESSDEEIDDENNKSGFWDYLSSMHSREGYFPSMHTRDPGLEQDSPSLTPSVSRSNITALTEDTSFMSARDFLCLSDDDYDDADSFCGDDHCDSEDEDDDSDSFFVITPDLTSLSIQIDSTRSISDIKKQVSKVSGIPISDLRLVNYEDGVLVTDNFQPSPGDILTVMPSSVVITLPDCSKLELSVFPNAQIGDLKDFIEGKTDTNRSKQVLCFLETDCELDDTTIIENDCSLQLSTRSYFQKRK